MKTNRWVMMGGVASMLLAACGGASEAREPTANNEQAQAAVSAAPSQAPSATTPAATAPSPAPSPAPAPAPNSSTANCGLAAMPEEMITALNARRARGASCGTAGNFNPALPLSWSAPLASMAYGHSLDMVTANFFSHTSSNGDTLGVRIQRVDYAWSAVGENIAAGFSTTADVVDAWMRSDGHCKNIMNPAYQHAGASCVVGTASTVHSNYWTLNFGAPAN
jgi:uncharacterized protein YkwD